MLEVYNQFPALYQGLLPEIMNLRIPQETKANCSHCTMVHEQSAVGCLQKHQFRADTKCCTYHPRLPNYLVGALLNDERPSLAEGRLRMRAKIDNRTGVTPWWIGPSVLERHLYEQVRGAFGKTARLRCPFYEEVQGNCTVWAYRESVCSTWYCKYDAGKDGLQFWTTLKGYMGHVENHLARFAMMTIDSEYVLDDHAMAFYLRQDLSKEDLDGVGPDASSYARLWRHYEGRQEDFYRECAGIVQALSPAEVRQILGLDGDIKAADTKRRHETILMGKLPAKLCFNPNATVRWLENGEVALGAYSEYDALALPGESYRMLQAFDGVSSTEETRQKIRTQFQTDFSDDILLTLYRYRILE